MEIHFVEGCRIPPADQAEITAVLRTVLQGSEEPGRWPASVGRVDVLRRLAGGRSGAEVIEINVIHNGAERVERQVAKLSTLKDAKAEWSAYREHVAGHHKIFCLGIRAVTGRVLDQGGGLADDRQAIVYQHAVDFAADREASITQLQELVQRGMAGDDDALQQTTAAVALLMRQVGDSFHGPVTTMTGRESRWPNRNLGTDLVLEVNHIADGELRYGFSQPSERKLARVFPLDILRVTRVSTDPPHPVGSDTRIRPGGLVHLALSGIEPGGAGVVGRAEDVTVEVRVAAGLDAPLNLEPFVGRDDIGVYGRVVRTRIDDRWDTIARHLPGLVADEHGVTLDAVCVGHPFGPLGDLLGTSRPAWAAATVHGDLNARNILLVHSQPFLIDYARTAANRPLLGDAAWLEVTLVRDVLAAYFEWPDLVRMMRLLAFASRYGAAPEQLLAEEAPELRRAFRVLWQIRSSAALLHRGITGRPWWQEYFEEVVVAAYRTLKWPPEEQGTDEVRGVVVAAGVAAENLAPGALGWWPAVELEKVLAVVVADPSVGDDDKLAVFADLVATLDAAGGPSEAIDAVVARATTTVVRHRFRSEARLLHSELASATHFIDLAGYRTGPTPGQVDSVVRFVADQPAMVILGEAGAGKSTIARHVAYRLATALVRDESPEAGASRLPIQVRAAAVGRSLSAAGTQLPPGAVLHAVSGLADLLGPATFAGLLAVGALHVSIDDLNEAPADRAKVVEWLRQLRRAFPRVQIVVCNRTFDHQHDALGFPTVTLHSVSETQARAYLGADLAHLLFETDEHRGLRDATSTPMLLWLLAEWYEAHGSIPASTGALFADFTRRYLGPGSADRLPALELIAERMVRDGNATEIPRAVAADMLTDRVSVLDELLASGILHSDGDLLRFRHQLFQEHFAAHALARSARDDPAGFRDRILSFEWREPTRILLGSHTTDPGLATDILHAAVDADPRYAAWLLQAAENAPADVVATFVDRQVRVLATADAGRHELIVAARALAVHGSPAAVTQLARIAGDAALPSDARVVVVEALAAAVHWSTARPATVDALTGALRDVLASAEPAPVDARVAALRAVADATLTTLVGPVWEQIRPDAPWPVIREAHRTLVVLGMTTTPSIDATYRRACEVRLAEIDVELRATAVADTIRDLDDERFALVHDLADTGRLDLLLPRRFSFGLAERPGWADLLARAATVRVSQAPDDPAARILTGRDTDRQRAFAEADDACATAAAHSLLVEEPTPPYALLSTVTADSSPARLLAVAAVAESLGETELGAVVDLIKELAERPDPELLEPLAALVSAVDRPSTATRVDIARTVQSALVHHDVDGAARWPWARAWCDTVLDEDDIGRLLDRSPSWAGVALEYLSGIDFLLDAGGRPPYVPLTDAARQHVAGLRPVAVHGPEAEVFVAGASFLGLVGELPYVRSVAGGRADEDPVCHVHARFGPVELDPAAHALAAVGYLGRLAGEAGDLGTCWDARTTLLGADVTRHPSLIRAQTVGLGFLGVWEPAFTGLVGHDPVALAAARNIVRYWFPGPCTPDEQDPATVTRWTADRLATGDPVDSRVRSLLGQVKEDMNLRLKRYVV